MRKLFWISLLWSLKLSLCLASYWDQDTRMRAQRPTPFPLELITGHFLTHGPEFYYWRIQDRERLLESYPDSLPLYDDLAVAYDKLGNHERAIIIAQLAELKDADRYETYANLATFSLHQGRYPQALQYLEKARPLNPGTFAQTAQYQTYVAEYLLSLGQTDTVWLPLNVNQLRYAGHQMVHGEFNARMLERDTIGEHTFRYRFIAEKASQINFYEFLLRRYHEQVTDTVAELPPAQLQAAIEGVSGMIYADLFETPVLLDVLGELLAMDQTNPAARYLAALSFLQAGLLSQDKAILYAYRIKVSYVLAGLGTERLVGISELERLLDQEERRVMRYQEAIRADENCWIAREIHPEKAFAKKYYAAPPPRSLELGGALADVAQTDVSDLTKYLNQRLRGYAYLPPTQTLNGLYPSVQRLLEERGAQVYRSPVAADSLETDCVWVQEVRKALGGTPDALVPGQRQGKRSFTWLMILAVLGGVAYFLWDWRRHPPKKS